MWRCLLWNLWGLGFRTSSRTAGEQPVAVSDDAVVDYNCQPGSRQYECDPDVPPLHSLWAIPRANLRQQWVTPGGRKPWCSPHTLHLRLSVLTTVTLVLPENGHTSRCLVITYVCEDTWWLTRRWSGHWASGGSRLSVWVIWPCRRTPCHPQTSPRVRSDNLEKKSTLQHGTIQNTFSKINSIQAIQVHLPHRVKAIW